VTVD
jgi:hypothetical protein